MDIPLNSIWNDGHCLRVNSFKQHAHPLKRCNKSGTCYTTTTSAH
jgi:hypothetical protein